MKNNKKLGSVALVLAALILFSIIISSVASAASEQSPLSETSVYISNDGSSNVSVDVPASPLWTDTKIKVVKGQTVSIKASGTWNTGNGECGPDGEDTTHSDLFLTSDAPSKHGELIAFIGPQSTDPYQGHWGNGSFFPQPTGAGYWAIGSSETFTTDRNGELWLGINDDAVTKNIGDNTGSLATVIKATTSVIPVAKFSAKPTSGKAPLIVAFADKSTGDPTKWKWDFGDGTNSTKQNPTHKYSKAGKYTVSLTVKNAAGSNTTTKKNYIAVTAPVKPVANFSASPTSGNAPLKVKFTDKSIGSPTSWNWSFGDGDSSTLKNPAYTYAKAGKYTVSLTAKNAAGSSTKTIKNYITVKTAPLKPAAAFSASPTSGTKPLVVTFTDKSTNNPTSWKWNFGDGTTSTTHNPIHTYIKTGSHTVTLTATNSPGSNTVTKSSYITVTNPVKPVAAFSASPRSGTKPLKVQFTDSSIGLPTSWSWDFGDGTTSTTHNPLHTYIKKGKLTVKLTVKNAAGSSTKTMTNYIIVK